MGATLLPSQTFKLYTAMWWGLLHRGFAGGNRVAGAVVVDEAVFKRHVLGSFEDIRGILAAYDFQDTPFEADAVEALVGFERVFCAIAAFNDLDGHGCRLAVGQR